jgi:hypothetical protein
VTQISGLWRCRGPLVRAFGPLSSPARSLEKVDRAFSKRILTDTGIVKYVYLCYNLY